MLPAVMTDPTDLDLTETDADVAFPSASPNQYDDLTIDDDGDEEEGDEESDEESDGCNEAQDSARTCTGTQHTVSRKAIPVAPRS